MDVVLTVGVACLNTEALGGTPPARDATTLGGGQGSTRSQWRGWEVELAEDIPAGQGDASGRV